MIKSSTLPASTQLICWDRNAAAPASIATLRLGCVFHGRYGKSEVKTPPVSFSRPALR